MKSVSRIATVALAAVVLAACGDMDLPTGVTDPAVGPMLGIHDGAQGSGVPHFYFLPPIGSGSPNSGAFDATASPIVEVLDCGTDPSCSSPVPHASFSMSSGSGSETVRVTGGHYMVNWHTNKTGTKSGHFYRIVVRLGGMELGYADAYAAKNGKEANGLNGNYIVLMGARTLPIKFRIEKGLASPAHTTIAADPSEITADGESTATVTVQLMDANGNPLASSEGYTVTLSTTRGTLSDVSDHGNGTFMAILTAPEPEDAGEATITGTLNGAPIGNSAKVTFVEPPPPPTATALQIVMQPSGNAQAGVAFGQQPVIQILDQNGNALALKDVTVTVSLGANAENGTLGGTTTATTDENGRAEFSGLLIDGKVGDFTLKFSVDGLTGAESNTIKLAAGPAAKMEAVDGNLQEATAGETVETAPSVRVTDRSGNPVSGIKVRFEASGNGQVTGGEPTTDSDGIARVGSWKLATTAGQNMLTASADGLDDVIFTAAGKVGPAAKIIVKCTEGCPSNNELAPGTEITLSAQLFDQYDNPVTEEGLQVTWSVGDESETKLTNSDGIATIQLKVDGEDGEKFTVAATAGTITGESPEFTVVSPGGSDDPDEGTPAKFIVTCTKGCNANNEHVGGSGPVELTAQLVDEDGNPVRLAGLEVTWRIETYRGLETLTQAQTNSDGISRFERQLSGSDGLKFTVTVTAGAITGQTVITLVHDGPGDGGGGGKPPLV